MRLLRSSIWTSTFSLAALLTLVATLLAGQDRNWDLRNYHFYTPSALLDGRFGTDIAVAQMQTWHNPTADLPFAWMVRVGLPGWLVSLWLALPALLALCCALRLMDRLWPEQKSRWRTCIAALVALTGAAVGPSLGSTFNDAIAAAGALGALWWAVESHGRRGAVLTWLPAGLMAGAATGLKLTGAIYCVGLVAAMCVAGPIRNLPARLLALAIGGVAGTLLTAAPWAWVLWRDHGNPLFPYFNHIFLSADALAQPYNDPKFIPHGPDAWLVPFHLLLGSTRFSEAKMADPRLLLGLIAWALACLAARKQRARQPATASAPGLRMLTAFTATSFVCWVLMYGIYRYLFAVEMLCSVVICAVAMQHWPARWPRYTVLLAALVLIGLTNRPGWGRDHRFSTPMIDVQFPSLPADALVITSSIHPLAHAIAFLPPQIGAVAVANNFMDPQRCTRLQQRAEQTLRTHQGPLYLLRETASKDPDPLGDRYQLYGLRISDQCQPVRDSLRKGKIELCPLAQVVARAPLCAVAPQAGR